jgi:hypothetical protein
MAAQPDLWGDLGVANVLTPVAILREQAALLGTKTQQLIEAKVETETYGKDFKHSFNLVVPALDNYRYELFWVKHDIDLYPVQTFGQGQSAKTESDFVNWLQEQLSSPKTRRIIGNLLAQVNR